MDKTKISATILLLITIAIVLSFNFDVTTVHDADQSILYVNESQTLSPTEQGITSSSLYALNNSYLEFDGVDDYVNTIKSGNDFQTGDFSFSTWINDYNKSKTSGVIGTSSDFGSQTSAGFGLLTLSNKYRFTICNGSQIIGNTNFGTLTSGWHNVIGVRNSTHISLYVDNVLLSNLSVPTGFNISVNRLLNIGKDTPAGRYFNGFIDEVRIYNRSLEESEITEIYNSGRYKNLSLPSDGLVLYMPFEETNGTTIYDNSGNNNNGELIYE